MVLSTKSPGNHPGFFMNNFVNKKAPFEAGPFLC